MIKPMRGFLLDRDGTLIVDKDYLRDPAGVELLPGVVEGLKLLQPHGPLIVISNQSGVARGLMTEDDVKRVNTRLEEILKAHEILISAQYYCPYHPDFGITPPEKIQWRKPGTGMATAAAVDLGIELTDSFVIGDKESDLLLARDIGATAVLVRTGYGKGTDKTLAHKTASNFHEAAEWIIQKIDESKGSWTK